MATVEVTVTSPVPSSSSSASDNFLFETRYVVLSFLNQVTKENQPSNLEKHYHEYFQHWKSKSIHPNNSSPTRKKKRFKKPLMTWKLKTFSSDESIPTYTQSKRNISKKSAVSKLPVIDGQGGDEDKLQHKNRIESPRLHRDAPPSNVSHTTFHRRSSNSSSSDGGSFGDADDELESSQGSTLDGLKGAKLGYLLRGSHPRQHLHIPRLPTVASESEGDTDLPPVIGSPNGVLGGESPSSATSPTGIFSSMDAERDEFQLILTGITTHSGEQDSDILARGQMDSDTSELESDGCLGTKGDTEEEEEDIEEEEEEEGRELEGESLSAAVGGCGIPGRNSPRSRSVDRSCLFLNLPASNQAVPHSDRVESVMASLREEIHQELSSMESDFDEANRPRGVSQSPLLQTPMTPCTEAAFILARIGDDFQESHLARVDSAISQLFEQSSSRLTYEAFLSIARTIVDTSAPGWSEVAMLLIYSQGVALRMLSVGGESVGKLVDYSVRLLSDLAADFIIQQGGWSGLVSDCSSSCISSPEPWSSSTRPDSGTVLSSASSLFPTTGATNFASPSQTSQSPFLFPLSNGSISSSVDRNVTHAFRGDQESASKSPSRQDCQESTSKSPSRQESTSKSPSRQESTSRHPHNNSSEIADSSKTSADSPTDAIPQPPSESSQQATQEGAMGGNSSVVSRRNAVFITKFSAASLAAITLGLGLALAYIKR